MRVAPKTKRRERPTNGCDADEEVDEVELVGRDAVDGLERRVGKVAGKVEHAARDVEHVGRVLGHKLLLRVLGDARLLQLQHVPAVLDLVRSGVELIFELRRGFETLQQFDVARVDLKAFDYHSPRLQVPTPPIFAVVVVLAHRVSAGERRR